MLGAHCGQRFQPAARALPWRVTGHRRRSAGLGRLPLPGCPTAASPVLMVWGGGGWHTWGGTGSLVLLGLSCRPLPLPPIEEVLESYENPPPIVLPSEGFQVDLEADCLDDSIYQHLLYIRHFLWSLRSKPSPSGGSSQLGGLEVPGAAGGGGVDSDSRVAGGSQLRAWLLLPLGVPRAPLLLPPRPAATSLSSFSPCRPGPTPHHL